MLDRRINVIGPRVFAHGRGAGRLVFVAVLALLRLSSTVAPSEAQSPEPTVTKVLTNDPGRPFRPGETAIFQITVENTTGSDIEFELSDYFSPNVSSPTAAPSLTYDTSIADCTYTFEAGGEGHVVRCSTTAPLPAGRAWRLEIGFRIDPTACVYGAIPGDPAFSWGNLLTWRWRPSKLDWVQGSDIQVPIQVEEPAEGCRMWIGKQGPRADVRPGDAVTFQITVANLGADYHLYDGFSPTLLMMDVVPAPLQIVTVTDDDPNIACIDVPYDGTPPSRYPWNLLPAVPGTLVWCVSPPRDASWVFPGAPSGLDNTFTVTIEATAPPDLDPCSPPVENRAFLAYGFLSDTFPFGPFHGMDVIESSPWTVTWSGCRTPPPTTPPPTSPPPTSPPPTSPPPTSSAPTPGSSTSPDRHSPPGGDEGGSGGLSGGGLATTGVDVPRAGLSALSLLLAAGALLRFTGGRSRRNRRG